MAQINFDSGTNVSLTINRGPLNGGVPGGSQNALQFNRNGVFGGVANVSTDGNSVLFDSVTNIQINGGAPGQVLVTDGNGVLSWTDNTGGGGTPAGSDFEIQFANAGNFSADANLRFIPAISTLIVPEVETENLVATNNVTTTNLTTVGQVRLGSVANVSIGGGTVGQILRTDGNGVLSWVTDQSGALTPPAGTNTQVQFNNNGAFGADAEFYYNPSSNTLTVTNFVAVNLYGNAMGLTDITGANVSGIVRNANYSFWAGNAENSANADTAKYSDEAETVTGSNQPNITSLGTLDFLNVVGLTNLSDLANLRIGGGNTGEVLTTRGDGNLYWTAGSGGGSGSGDIQVYFDYTDTQKLIGILPTNKVLTAVNVVILEPFNDPAAQITVGTVSDTDSLQTASDNTPALVGEFTTYPITQLQAQTQLVVAIAPASSTAGLGLVYIQYQ